MDKKTLNDNLMFIAFLVIGVVLAFGIIKGYDKYSYNQGFYDGLMEICDKDIILKEDTGEFYCADIKELESLAELEMLQVDLPIIEIGEMG